MKSILIFLLFILQSLHAFSKEIGRMELRNSFHACSTSEKTESFYKVLSNANNSNSIIQGYRGAVIAMRAKYGSNPMKKYTNCKDGLRLISDAIEKSPDDLELRYLRLLIESNIPAFLGMNYNVKEDKKIILNRINKEEDLHLRQMISSFLIKSDICTDEEKKLLASK
jgi:hypothetical protein